MPLTELLLKLLIVAYAANGIISTIAYWPTIKDLFNKKKSANIDSYWLWTLTGAIAFLYSIFILDDWLVRIVVGLSFACCAIILVLSIGLKHSK
jgi:hypothetical protein